MICSDWLLNQQQKDYILIMRILIEAEMQGMISMIQERISQRWDAEQRMVGILMAWVSRKTDVEIFVL